MERTLSVGHVEQVGLRGCGACLTLLSLRQLDTHTQTELIQYIDSVQDKRISFIPSASRHNNHHLM